MFGFGTKRKEIVSDNNLYAPVTGELIPLDQVSDPIFAQKIMGDGFAVEPLDGEIVSPVAGQVIIMQGHAIGFRRADGLEILLHLGIDTVSLNGSPFHMNVKVGDILEAGEKIGQADWSLVDQADLPRTTMILISNTADKLADLNILADNMSVTKGKVVGQARAK